MKIEKLVRENFQALSERDLKFFSYIVQNKEAFVAMDIEQLAEETGLSISQISKFAKKLGLDGFSELKYLVKRDEGGATSFDEREIDYTYNDISMTMGFIRDMELTGLFRKMDRAGRIYALPTGYAQKNVAEEFKRNLLNVQKSAYLVDLAYDGERLAGEIEDSDMVFIFSLSGENERALDFLGRLKNKPTIVSITRMSNNSLAHKSTYNLPFITHEVYKFEKRTTISPISQYYVIIDFLLLKYLYYRSKKEG